MEKNNEDLKDKYDKLFLEELKKEEQRLYQEFQEKVIQTKEILREKYEKEYLKALSGKQLKGVRSIVDSIGKNRTQMSFNQIVSTKNN